MHVLTHGQDRGFARRLGLTTLAAVGALLAMGSAGACAATLNNGSFVAGPGETNNLVVTDTGPTFTYVDSGAAITASGTCLPAGLQPAGTPIACAAVNSINITLADLGDQTTFVGPVDANLAQDGGTGNDTLRGSQATTFNSMVGGPGADILAGGPGGDYAFYVDHPDAVAISLDNVANDGSAGEGDNVSSSVENLFTGPGNDTVTGSAANNIISTGVGNDVVSGGAGDDDIDTVEGNDSVSGDAGDDSLNGGAGSDTVSGGDGDDRLQPGDTVGGSADGVDVVSGGAGVDFAFTSAFDVVDPAVSITLDDLANDGVAGEADNYHSDIEDLASSSGPATLVGTSAINTLFGGPGNDVLDPRAGNDVVSGGAGDDTLLTRDGFSDRVVCGTGTDTVLADTLDQISGNCENVQVVDVGNANDTPEDAPPTIAFVAPAANALLPGRASTVTVNAADDRGIARVVLIDDGRVVATDTTAPYAFSYQPNANDIGSNTLIAQAVDGANQASTAIRAVRVDRFSPRRVSATVSPSRDRTGPYRFRTRGTVSMPTGVTRAQGCKAGTVSVSVKRGTRTISTRRAKLSKACTYSSSVTFASRARLGNGRLRITARFGGNSVLKARNAATRSVRAG